MGGWPPFRTVSRECPGEAPGPARRKVARGMGHPGRPPYGSAPMLEDLLIFAAVGFAAQMIDGAIGMAYGLSASSVLLTLGVAPATASASVHAAEVFTTGASGLAHWRLGNVRGGLVLRLAVPGVLGGVLGATVLVEAPTAVVRVFVSAYLLALGGVILLKALRPRPPAAALPTAQVGALGFCGGVLDAIGGGGWGA